MIQCIQCQYAPGKRPTITSTTTATARPTTTATDVSSDSTPNNCYRYSHAPNDPAATGDRCEPGIPTTASECLAPAAVGTSHKHDLQPTRSGNVARGAPTQYAASAVLDNASPRTEGQNHQSKPICVQTLCVWSDKVARKKGFVIQNVCSCVHRKSLFYNCSTHNRYQVLMCDAITGYDYRQ